ncbi:MAG: hemolysin III family protein [Myxococcales bacterium]|nr:hemolysin III family protein [Myxococcales bacterium]USN51357.1 MAG: hemolysin III family protein [Myxococcales bacterium]
MNINVKQYSRGEEIANSIIHGIGALFSVVGTTVLLTLAIQKHSALHLISYTIYGSSLIFLYTASTLYHALPFLTAKKIFKIFDHIGIYLLIAGTYTPFLLINMKGTFALIMMAVIWTLAGMGLIFKLFFTGRFRLLSTILYVAMGWLIVVAYKPLAQALEPAAMQWLLIGGLFYTGGSVTYLMKKISYHHAIWHVFVILGSLSHYIAVVRSM